MGKIIIKIIIALLHFSMLGWILWLLKEGGRLEVKEVFLHFLGLSLMGFGLIRGTSKIEMMWFRSERKK